MQISVSEEIRILNAVMRDIDYLNESERKRVMEKFLNLVEKLYQQLQELLSQNQELRDENKRLKGEKGKPDIKPNKTSKERENTSGKDSDNEESPLGKKPKKKWKKSRKLDKIEIDEELPIPYEGDLPLDAQSKGYRSVVIQNIEIKRHNIEYQLQRYYSPLKKKTYEAKLPADVEGEFGAELKAYLIYLYHECRVPEGKIHQALYGQGIMISEGQISNLLIKKQERFHEEKKEIMKQGIASSEYQHIDDTGARVMGVNQYFSVLCNEYYSAFFIHPKKNRLTVLEILNQRQELSYTLNEATFIYLNEKKVPRHIIDALTSVSWPEQMLKEPFITKLKQVSPKIKRRYIDMIVEAAGLTWYQEKNSSEKIKILVSDAAKQFSGITELNALCWIHEERHYKNLIPIFDIHKKQLKNFRSKIWDYYRKLEAYKLNPDEEVKKDLREEFNELFSTHTGYDALDDCISMTMSRKKGLLVVLDHPEVALHNNPAELAIRDYVVKRKISYQTRSQEGTRSWETFLTIKDTCRKLGVNFYDYLYDRISNEYKMPHLASLIPKMKEARASP